MAEKSFEQAVQVLKQQIGGQWAGAEEDGRGEMTRILKNELGYTSAEADNALAEMIRSGQLRYYHHAAGSGAETDTSAYAAEGQKAGMAVATSSGLPPVPVSMDLRSGYWEIGSGEGDELAGRRGQVVPS